MASIDEQIAAKKAKDKKKKPKKKKHHYADDGSDLDENQSTEPSRTPDDIADIIAARKIERRMHNLASSGLPKQPPEIEYNLDPPKKEKKKKKKHHGELKTPPEELIIGEGFSAASAFVPGAKYERLDDVSEAERLKYGHVKPATAGVDTNVVKKNSTDSAASLPGVRQSSAEDLTPAERTKFGYSKKASTEAVASMPGARQRSSEDLTPAERTKFGLKSTGTLSNDPNVASMPGAKSETIHDVSEAERLKYGQYKPSSPGTNEISPGARQGRSHDVSEAERLKYGQSAPDSRCTIGAVETTEDDINAAARLKFSGVVGNEQARNATPRAVQADNSNTSEAERIKFGLVEQFAGRKQSSDDSESSIHEEEDDEIRAVDDGKEEHGNGADIETNYHKEATPRRKLRGTKALSLRSSRQSPQNETRTRRGSLRESFLSIYSGVSFDNGDINPDDSGEKRKVDIWRPCCQICTCISFIIIIALSASLGAANKKAASYSMVETSIPVEAASAVTTPMPSVSPSLEPTTAPEDFSFCYTQNEFAMLNRPRYSSLRSELVSTGVSTSNEFSDMNSYQRKALCWLAFGDRASLNGTDPFLEQRYALSTIYFALNESKILLDNGWLSGQSECQWKPMVECDSRTESTVTKLFLADSDLIGQLPKELGYLQDTTYLDVGINQLEGDVTDAIGSWSNLMSLRLASNKFTSIPDLSMFPSLTHLDISENQISGQIPSALATSASLAYLDLSINMFEGTIPTDLGELKSLKSLYLYLNDLRGSLPGEICSLRDVELKQLAVDCGGLGGEVECKITCCTACYPNVGNKDSPFI